MGQTIALCDKCAERVAESYTLCPLDDGSQRCSFCGAKARLYDFSKRINRCCQETTRRAYYTEPWRDF